MNSILSVPENIERIGGEIDYHGDKIQQEIFTMHQIIDQQGKGIQDNIYEQGVGVSHEIDCLKYVIDENGRNINEELEKMRKSFEKEMTDLKQTAKVTCVLMFVANVLSRVFFK